MYSSLVIGGTFDHFHAGHEALLACAFSHGKHVLLGLTEQEMSTTKAYGTFILPYAQRKREIEECAARLGKLDDIEIIPINNVFGTTLDDIRLEAIVVTPHTQHGADVINRERKQRGMSQLVVHVCDLVMDDEGSVLSSTRIRSGLVNRNGFVYSHLFADTRNVSEKLKQEVRKPLGESLLSFPDLSRQTQPTIYVGDIVTDTAVKMHLPIASAWIDGISARQPYTVHHSAEYVYMDAGLTNLAGSIQSSMVSFMRDRLVGNNTIYSLQGEEDLLVLPAILLSPLETRVIYGNPFGQKGVTIVHVTEEKKEEIRNLLEMFVR